MPPRHSRTLAEIKQTRPFRSVAQEATIALLRTASVVNRTMQRLLEPWSLSLAQYNALRIVRGAGAQGITTLAVRERMIEEGTPITRILDKLEAGGYLRRERSTHDRRAVLCYVTDEGRRLLAEIDPLADATDDEAVAVLADSELETFIALLDAIRLHNSERAAPRTMVRAESVL
ncbi:MAG: MarR family transcriptional regulator [Gemmatimonadota bacterium]